jgi:hypothetical protein
MLLLHKLIPGMIVLIINVYKKMMDYIQTSQIVIILAGLLITQITELIIPITGCILMVLIMVMGVYGILGDVHIGDVHIGDVHIGDVHTVGDEIKDKIDIYNNYYKYIYNDEFF